MGMTKTAGTPTTRPRPRHGALRLDPQGRDRLLTRLRRVEGQVRGVQKMVEGERYCPDLA